MGLPQSQAYRVQESTDGSSGFGGSELGSYSAMERCCALSGTEAR